MEVTGLTPNQWYCVTVSEACTITAEDGTGYTQTLATPKKAGQYMVKTISDKLTIDDDDHALVEGPFRVAPAGGFGGGEFDGHLDNSLYIGNGDEAAVAAVCTLTLGDLATGGTLTDGTVTVELDAPEAVAAGGWLQYARDGRQGWEVNGIGISPPDEGDVEDESAWKSAVAAADCGVRCTSIVSDAEIVKVYIEALEPGESGNAITLYADAGNEVSGATLEGGADGVYSVAEIVSAINAETDFAVTAAAAETEGAVTLTANTAGAAANAVVYTATGCFGGGSVKQGSTTRGRNAVAQTAFKIYLNGEELDVEPAPLPTALTPTTAMRNRGVYTVDAEGEALDFSAVTLEAYRAASVWLDYNGPSELTWPAWSWATEDGLQPNFDYFHRYKLEMENDGVKTRAVVADSYATHPVYRHTELTQQNMTDTSLELYIVPDETASKAGAYISGSVDMWGAFSVDEFAGFCPPTSLKNMNGDSVTWPILPGEFADFGKNQGHERPMITFCTSRPVSVHAVSLWADSNEPDKTCVVVQAEVDGEWVLLGGKVCNAGTEYVIKPAAPVTASKFRVQFGVNAWYSLKFSKIHIYEVLL